VGSIPLPLAGLETSCNALQIPPPQPIRLKADPISTQISLPGRPWRPFRLLGSNPLTTTSGRRRSRQPCCWLYDSLPVDESILRVATGDVSRKTVELLTTVLREHASAGRPGIPTPSAPSCFGRLNRIKALYSSSMGSSRTIMNAMHPTILSWVLSRSRSLLRSYSSRAVARLISPIIALSSCLLSRCRRI